MLTTAPRADNVADPAEVGRMSGREFLQAIIDGRLPAPPIASTLSFWLTEMAMASSLSRATPGRIS